MTAGGVFRAVDGRTIFETVGALKAAVDDARDAGVKAIAGEARDIITDEGHRFYIRARKTRKPVRLGAKQAKTTAGRTVIEGDPWGFWSIVENGSSRTWRIERKPLGRGNNRRARVLSTPYGPRPYVIRHGQRPMGHPWAQAMSRVEAMPDSVFATPVAKVLDKAWNG